MNTVVAVTCIAVAAAVGMALYVWRRRRDKGLLDAMIVADAGMVNPAYDDANDDGDGANALYDNVHAPPVYEYVLGGATDALGQALYAEADPRQPELYDTAAVQASSTMV
jgi:hypothetical protein